MLNGRSIITEEMLLSWTPKGISVHFITLLKQRLIISDWEIVKLSYELSSLSESKDPSHFQCLYKTKCMERALQCVAWWHLLWCLTMIVKFRTGRVYTTHHWPVLMAKLVPTLSSLLKVCACVCDLVLNGLAWNLVINISFFFLLLQIELHCRKPYVFCLLFFTLKQQSACPTTWCFMFVNVKSFFFLSLSLSYFREFATLSNRWRNIFQFIIHCFVVCCNFCAFWRILLSIRDRIVFCCCFCFGMNCYFSQYFSVALFFSSAGSFYTHTNTQKQKRLGGMGAVQL